MGHIKEPKGIDLIIGPSVLTKEDRKMISEIIASYKLTGKRPTKKLQSKPIKRTPLKKRILA